MNEEISPHGGNVETLGWARRGQGVLRRGGRVGSGGHPHWTLHIGRVRVRGHPHWTLHIGRVRVKGHPHWTLHIGRVRVRGHPIDHCTLYIGRVRGLQHGYQGHSRPRRTRTPWHHTNTRGRRDVLLPAPGSNIALSAVLKGSDSIAV